MATRRCWFPPPPRWAVLMIALRFAEADDVITFTLWRLQIAAPGLQFGLIGLAMGAFLYALHAIYIAAAMDVAEGEAQSTVVSLIYGASFLGALSPFIAGVIVDFTDTASAFVYGGVMVLAATLILVFTRLPKTFSQLTHE